MCFFFIPRSHVETCYPYNIKQGCDNLAGKSSIGSWMKNIRLDTK